jgi:Tol biopolymer transport system component
MPRFLKYTLFIIVISIRVSSEASCQAPIFDVKPLSFNSPVFSDIAPVILKDGILFCSDRRTSSLSLITTFNDEHLYNIYFAARKDTSGWEKPRLISSAGSPVLYYGPLCLAPDGKTVYFTSGILTGKAAKKKTVINPRGIFIGELSGTSINNVRPFEYNNPKYSVAQPSISRDGKYLFFASDMPGGVGASDIYYCELINNKWGPPVNLGGKVNSKSSENYPFIHPSGRLYFSSDRPGGLGGLDIYYTILNNGTWEEPVLLPPQINSASDDFAFVAEESLQTGYFSSNRDKKNDNIFRFSSTIIRKVKCDTLQINSYEYEFYDENAMNFDTTLFRYEWDFGDDAQAEGVKVVHSFKGPGKYSIRLDVVNLVTKEVKKNEKTIDLKIKDVEQPYISCPEVCKIGKQIKLNADSTNLPGWNIKQYYWNFGDETVASGKEVNKAFIKSGNFNIQLIVTSLPDASGKVKEACVSKNINVIR